LGFGSFRYLATLSRESVRVRAIVRMDCPSWARRWISKIVRLSIMASSLVGSSLLPYGFPWEKA
jgi:hypothetical protein